MLQKALRQISSMRTDASSSEPAPFHIIKRKLQEHSRAVPATLGAAAYIRMQPQCIVVVVAGGSGPLTDRPTSSKRAHWLRCVRMAPCECALASFAAVCHVYGSQSESSGSYLHDTGVPEIGLSNPGTMLDGWC